MGVTSGRSSPANPWRGKKKMKYVFLFLYDGSGWPALIRRWQEAVSGGRKDVWFPRRQEPPSAPARLR